MDIETSPKFTMSRYDWYKWFYNVKKYTAPVLTLYLVSVLGIIQGEGHVITRSDFIPNTYVVGGIATYVLSSLLDLVTKWSKGY